MQYKYIPLPLLLKLCPNPDHDGDSAERLSILLEFLSWQSLRQDEQCINLIN